MIELTPEQNQQIDAALMSGRKIDAIRLCRESSGCGLVEARAYVESRPAAAAVPASTPVSGGALLGAVLVVAVLAGAAYLIMHRGTKPAAAPIATAPVTDGRAPAVATSVPRARPADNSTVARELIAAAQRLDVAHVRELLDGGTDVNTIEPGTEENALIAAMSKAFDRPYEMAQLLVERGIDVNHQRQGGATALLRAAQQQSVKTAGLLIEHGADVNLRPPNGGTPLDAALKSRNPRMIELLRSAGGKERVMLATMPVEKQ